MQSHMQKRILGARCAAGLERNRRIRIAHDGLIFGMSADDIGDHGLEGRERGMCQVLAPRLRVSLAQLLAGIGIK